MFEACGNCPGIKNTCIYTLAVRKKNKEDA
jgi:hypothetical protein